MRHRGPANETPAICVEWTTLHQCIHFVSNPCAKERPPPATNELERIHETEGRPWPPERQQKKNQPFSTKATNAPKPLSPTDVSMPPDTSPTDSTRRAPVLSLGTADQEAPGSMATRLFRAHQQLSHCWADVKLLRDQLKDAWARHRRYETFYLDSRSLFDHATDRTTDHYTKAVPAQTHASLQRMNDDGITLQTQFLECERLEHELTQAQERFERQETVFMVTSKELVSRISSGPKEEILAELSIAQDKNLSIHADEAFSKRLDTLLERYYDKAADLKLLGERLVNHGYWYQVETSVRGLRQDQGELLISSEQEFEEEYNRKRGMIEQELDIAIAEADQLRCECDAAGLDIEAYRRFAPTPSELGSDGTDHAPVLMPGHSPMATPTDFFHGFQGVMFRTTLAEDEVIRGSPSSESIDPSARTNPHVADWIASVSRLDLEAVPSEALESTHQQNSSTPSQLDASPIMTRKSSNQDSGIFMPVTTSGKYVPSPESDLQRISETPHRGFEQGFQTGSE